MASITEKVSDKAQEIFQSGANAGSKQSDKINQLKNSFAPEKGNLKTNVGVKIQDTDKWLQASSENGKQGPFMLEDQHAREKIFHFDHERMPERVVHARGVGAHGVFRLKESASDVTCAKVLTDTSRETPVFVRFSTVLGSKGAPDTAREVRGFAVKFYTSEGNWDIVGNNMPIFFIQDAIKFPDLVHAAKPEPHTEIPQSQTAHNNAWDFFSLTTESTAMTAWAMSDRAIPRSYRMVQGFGVNTFVLVDDQGRRNFVKFIFTPELGVHSLVWDEALKIAGQDPDFLRKDLYAAIENGVYPKWKFGIQCIKESDENKIFADFNILDSTKVWPEEKVPIRYIGELELNRNVDEFFPETEQVAFQTGHMVPGIQHSDDPLLQGRSFSYLDTQMNRFGSSNFDDLPINRPLVPVTNHQRDGFNRHRITPGTVNYTPNRFEKYPPASKTQGGYETVSYQIDAPKCRAHGPKFEEYLNQATQFYCSLAAHEQQHLIAAYSFELGKCDDLTVVERMVNRLGEVHNDLASTVAKAVGVDAPRSGSDKQAKQYYTKARGLSQTDFDPSTPTISTRRIAVLCAEEVDDAQVDGLRTVLHSKGGALCYVVGPSRKFKAASGPIMADFTFDTARSTLFDAVIVPPGTQHALTLRENGLARHFILEAFAHCKAIGAYGEGVDFIQQGCDLPGINLALDPESAEVVDSYGVVTSRKGAEFRNSAVDITSGKDFVSAFARNLANHRCWERQLKGLAAQVPA